MNRQVEYQAEDIQQAAIENDNSEFHDESEKEQNFRIPFHRRVVGFYFIGYRQFVNFLLATFDVVRGGINWCIWKCMTTLGLGWMVSKIAGLFAGMVGGIEFCIHQFLRHTIYSKTSWRFRDVGAWAFDKIRDGWGLLLGTIAKWSEQSIIVRWLLFPLRITLEIIGGSFAFLMIWTRTRTYSHLIYGIPAIALSIPLIICFVLIPLSNDQASTNHYRQSAQRALDAKDLKTAKLLYQKISILKGKNTSAAWGLAVVAEENGDLQEAYKQMQTLAPVEEPGSPLAHLWIAHKIANNLIDPQVDDPEALVEIHLDHVLKLQPDNNAALLMKADNQFKRGKNIDAIETLQRVKAVDMEAQLEKQVNMAILMAPQGNEAEVSDLLGRARNQFVEIFEKENHLRVGSYLNWAMTEEVLGEIPDAIKIVKLAMEEYPEPQPLLVTAYRELNLKLIRNLEMTGIDTAPERLDVALELYRIEPTNEAVLLEIARLTRVKALTDKALAVLKPLIDDNTLPVAVLERLALSSVVRGDPIESRNYYKMLVERDPNQPEALNNLAWLLAHHEPIDLEEALRRADQAIAIAPEEANIHATRGHILFKQSKWEQAIEELEIGLNGMPGNRNAHQAIATAYEQLGNIDLAQQHREAIERAAD